MGKEWTEREPEIRNAQRWTPDGVAAAAATPAKGKKKAPAKKKG